MLAVVEAFPPSVVVLGDLVTDVVLTPSRALRTGTDVTGTVRFRQGGSAATTARVLAGLGVATTLVTALGRDEAGDALEAYMTRSGVSVCSIRVAAGTGRLGVVVEPSGERSFVADRGAILSLRGRHLRREWFRGVAVLHLPVYSLLPDELGDAGERAARLAREEGARLSVDLSSAGFIEDAGGQVAERIGRIRPDLLFANDDERAALGSPANRLLDLAPVVVLKRGGAGATLCRRGREPVTVPARRAKVADSTGAGDAFDAGFLAAWLARSSSLVEAVRAGHHAASRELTGRRAEFELELAPKAAR